MHIVLSYLFRQNGLKMVTRMVCVNFIYIVHNLFQVTDLSLISVASDNFINTV